MKKQHYTLIATGLFLTLFSIGSSCHKKKKYCPKGSGTCRSVLEAKDFFLFKQGTWWVYEEEHTHQRDSQYVFQYNNTSGYDFDMRVLSSLENYEYHYYPSFALGAVETCSETEPVSGSCIYITRNKGKIGDFVGEGMCFFVNYHAGDYKYVSNQYLDDNKVIVTNVDTTLTISGLQLENVIKVHELNTLVEGRQPTNHYFKKNIGLVRKELIDSNQVWNLVNYHIEQ